MRIFTKIILLLTVPVLGIISADGKTLKELPLPTMQTITAAKNLPIPKTDTHPKEWANSGSIGPIGVIAQRSMTDLEYRILSIEQDAPAHGKLLPEDKIIGVNGELFKPIDYSGLEKSVKVYRSFMEPNEALGNAMDEAAIKNKGELILTVKRKDAIGTVSIQLPSSLSGGFSATYPWNCKQSELVAEKIAQRFAQEKLPYRKDLYATAWYGLFLLNHDPVKYRKVIEEVTQLIVNDIKKIRSGSPLRGYGGGSGVWQIAAYGIYLSEYAIITKQQKELLPHLNLLVDQLFDVQMVGNLWGHTKWHNYGTPDGGFMGASSQAVLALQCLKQAGAALDDSALHSVLDGISASINRDSGIVGYSSPDNGSVQKPFNWEKILKGTTQLGAESVMRQGSVLLAMVLNGRMEEARATSHFMERMILCHATHGIAPDWGILDGSRAFASYNPDACRKLLDAVRYRLNMCLRWDGDIYLVPYRNRTGEEYGVDSYRAENYVPAMWGLVLSMPKQRLYLLSKVLQPGAKQKNNTPEKPRLPFAIGVRHMMSAHGNSYYAAPDGETQWGIYEHDFSRNKTRLIKGGFSKPAKEIFVWDKKVLFSVPGAVWLWDGASAQELHKTPSGRYAAAQFTLYNKSIYFVSPPSSKEYFGGELWKTDGTKAGTVKIKDKIWMLLGGSGQWQTDMPNAQSLQVALGKLFFVTAQTPEGKPSNSDWGFWVSDGTTAGTVKLATPVTEVVAVENGQRRGSFVGFEYKDKLYFRADRMLWESDGTAAGTKVSSLNIRIPNNFTTFQGKLLFTGQSVGKGQRQSEIILCDGTPKNMHRFGGGLTQVHAITVVDKQFYFIANDGEHGEELWTSAGDEKSTKMVYDINPGIYGSVINDIISLDGHVYFSASNGADGMELWRSNGSASGTQVVDLNPGPNGSFPQQLCTDGEKLYFYTTSQIKGQQLWSYDPDKRDLPFRKSSSLN